MANITQAEMKLQAHLRLQSFDTLFECNRMNLLQLDAVADDIAAFRLIYNPLSCIYGTACKALPVDGVMSNLKTLAITHEVHDVA